MNTLVHFILESIMEAKCSNSDQTAPMGDQILIHIVFDIRAVSHIHENRTKTEPKL